MKLSYDLNLEQTQKLIMTPELRQAIEMLQFNSLELNEYLSKELEENPMLEREKPKDEFENIDDYTDGKEVDWKEYIEKYDDISYKAQTDKNIKDVDYESFITAELNLKDFLISQLNMVHFGVQERKIAEYIIYNIDDNGYFKSNTEEVSTLFKTNIEEVELVLNIIHTFDPVGVGARDLKECLLIQIRSRNNVVKYALEIVENHLDDIALNKIQKISKDLNITIDEVQLACDFIRTLEPKPGRSFVGTKDTVKYVTADAEIELIKDEFIVTVKDSAAPRLNINSYYKKIMQTGNDEKAKEYLNQKFNSAMWIIKSIEQRRSTIKKVVESILKFQMEFFLKGEKYLKPLTLKDVAEDIEMHESTISRTTNGKYVQTPRGLFELKYFFKSGLVGDEGDVSSTSIKSTLKDIIEKEDTKKPYSDQKISDILNSKGIKISRRTVAKYRDELKIPASSMRRRY